MTQPQVFLDEGRRLRDLARHEWLNLSLLSHARKAMRDDLLDIVDIRRVLRTGIVIRCETDPKWGGARWTVEGRTIDNRVIDVVVKIKEEECGILVITVFEVRL